MNIVYSYMKEKTKIKDIINSINKKKIVVRFCITPPFPNKNSNYDKI